jgi:hypothetical protein
VRGTLTSIGSKLPFEVSIKLKKKKRYLRNTRRRGCGNTRRGVGGESEVPFEVYELGKGTGAFWSL